MPKTKQKIEVLTESMKRWVLDPKTTMVTLQFVVEHIRGSLEQQPPGRSAALAAASTFQKKEAAAFGICAAMDELRRSNKALARKLAVDLLRFAPPPPPPRVHFEEDS